MRVTILALLIGAAALAQPDDWSRFRVDPARVLEHVRVLAADELEGRGNGSAGLRRAAEYIASEFRAAGLQPAGDSGSYLQAFDITTELVQEDDGLTVSTANGVVPFRLGVHYYPLSADGQRSAAAAAPLLDSDVVFAGYGISAPERHYDDYAGVDVRGRAVIVFTHEPQEHDPASAFDGTALTPHGALERKAAVARDRGARLLILVEDPSHVADRALTAAWRIDPQIGDYPLPVLRVDRARLERALRALDLTRAASAIDATLQPRSVAVAGARVTHAPSFAPIDPLVANVVGLLPGSDPALAREAIVIGGHYDHLGTSGRYSRDPAATGRIHNGADDNASGTSLLIEMARLAVRHRVRFRRSIVFAAFAGEELGLLGSRRYVQNPPVPTPQTVAMLNLDMVGRARGRVMVGGAERQPTFRRLLDELRPLSPLRLDDFAGGYGDGASDNAPFDRERIPTLLFFTGFHEDYHRPSDDWERIDADGAAEIARLALVVTARLAGR